MHIAKHQDNYTQSIELLSRMIEVAESNIHPHFNFVLVKALLLTMYYACLRVGEAIVSSNEDHSIKIENVHILEENAKTSIKIILISFKHSSQSKEFILTQSENELYCPVQALLSYLRLRVHKPGLLFTDILGRPLNRTFLVNKLKFLLSLLGLDPKLYNTHSLRAGRATDLARAGTSEAIIKETGRWRSDAYLKYVRFGTFKLPN